MAVTQEFDLLSGYRPELISREGRFFFAIPELGQVASGHTVQAAYDALVAQHAEMLAAARDADILDQLPPPALSPAAGAAPATARSDLKRFALKLGIVLIAVLIVALPVSWSISNAMTRAAVTLKAFVKPWRKLERELERAAGADKALSPERQAKLLAELRIVVSRVKPFADEIAPLFEGVVPAAEANPTQGEAQVRPRPVRVPR